MAPLAMQKGVPPPTFRLPRTDNMVSWTVREDVGFRQSREVDRKKEKKKNKRIRQKRRRAGDLSPSSSLTSASTSSSSEEELVQAPGRGAHTLAEILEQERKDTEERAEWYERVMSSPDEPEDIRKLCIELMELERALDQFDDL